MAQARPITIVCGLIGIGCAVTLPSPAWPYIDVNSLRVYASPPAVDVSMVIANDAGIVNGNRAISADTALRLGKYFGTWPEIWLGPAPHRRVRACSWRRTLDRSATRLAAIAGESPIDVERD